MMEACLWGRFQNSKVKKWTNLKRISNESSWNRNLRKSFQSAKAEITEITERCVTIGYGNDSTIGND